QDQRKLAEVSAFLLGSHTLVGATNYVLDREGANPLLRRAALDGGRALGMVVLSSRDQIRNSDVLARLRQGEDVQAEGYVILMHRATDHWFPLLADADHILRTYRYLIRQRVANLVHRFIANRLNHLMTTYGAGVFDLMYDHLCWRHRLGLSKAQLAALLIQDKVFDAGRLKELGFDPRAEKTSEGHNPWLILDEGKDEKSHQEFEAAWKKVSEALAPLLVRGAKEPAEGAQKPRALRTVLAALAAEEVFDPTDPRAQEALKSTQEAEYLSAVLQSLLETVPELFEGAAVESDESSGGDYYLTGPLAYLALLKEGHGLTGAQGKVSIRLLSARDRQGEHLDEGSRALAMQLTAALQSHSAGAALRGAIDTLRGWEVRWRHASQVGALFMIEQALRETVLSLAKPHPPLIQDLAGVPDEELLCLGSSLGDLNKFKRVITRSDRKDAFATLSEFASWLIRFERLREELERYRDLTEEITRIITGFQLSAFDAPHLHRYTMDMKALGALLDIRPEEMTAAHLAALEEKAMATVQVIHEIHEMERPLMLRDRWLSRTGMKLRQLYPHVELTFIHTLFERRRGGATEEGAPVRKPGEGGSSEFQTFSQRVRDVIAVRDRLENKRVFVLSPNNTQEKLTLSLLEQLQRLKGVTTPIFVDISGCESFADALRTRVPPYRLVDLNTL
ncbi:MAG: hypothetical protein OEW39_00875, partial [Deltaproteobacteria bacterium]|nr:hypothetical protein [Deltaproteobacteria bacterium]